MARRTTSDGRFPPEPEFLHEEYDFVIVGGGSAGCVLAARLSEVPEWSILLLEAGGDEGFFTDVPVFASYMQSTDYNWGYSTEPTGTSCLAMREGRCRWPRGKALGGTSVINYMVHSRGDPRDFDAWRDAGNPGWGFDDIEPFFRRVEDTLSPVQAAWHSPLERTFLEAGRQLGYPVHPPMRNSLLGFTPVLSHTRRGTRVSAARAWLSPASSRGNLHVVRRARVTKVVFDSRRRAKAVLFVRSKRKRRVRARKEVILSAGALNSPHLLMLSGVGPREHLEQVGIPVVADLPVGNNLHDHVAMGGLAFLVNSSVTLVESRLQKPSVFLNYVLRGKGPMTLPGGAEALAFIRTPIADGYGADIELAFGPGALPGDTGGSIREGLGLRNDVFQRVYGPYMGQDSWTAVPILLRPKSRGTVRLRSANPFHWPLLQPNYFQEKQDLNTLVEGIKMVSHAFKFAQVYPPRKEKNKIL